MWRNSKLLLSAVSGAQRSCQLAVWFTCLAGVSLDNRQKLDLHFINFPIYIHNGIRNPVKLAGVRFALMTTTLHPVVGMHTVMTVDRSHGAPR